MNWLEKSIANVSPGWASKRARARHALNLYEGAEPSQYHRSRRDSSGPNIQNQRSAEIIRDKARNLDQNFDIASGALDVLVGFTIGNGITPEPQALTKKDGSTADQFNQDLLGLWDDWIYTPEVTRQFDYYTFQQILARAWFRDGEVFSQKLLGPVQFLDHGTIVPYSLEGLESDFVPYLTDTSKGIYQGIQIDTWGRPTSYQIYKAHPNEALTIAVPMKTVPADRILHLKHVKRLHQLRGISVFASVLNRADDIKEIDESERVAARVSAAFAAYIKKGTPDNYTPDTSAEGTDGRTMEMVPGMVFDTLREGEEVGTIDPKRPNNALIPFRDAQLKSFAAGIRAGYSSLSRNYDGTYSSQRQELVEQHVQYRMCSFGFVYRFAQPVWDGFIDSAILGKKIDTSGIDPATIYNATHSLPPMPWINPETEVNAAVTAIANNLKSRSRTIRERGDNPDQVNREIERDMKEAERRGLPPPAGSPGTQQQQPAEPPKQSPKQRAA